MCVLWSPGAVPQGRYQLLLAQLILSITTSCSGTWPQGLGHQPSAKTGAAAAAVIQRVNIWGVLQRDFQNQSALWQ